MRSEEVSDGRGNIWTDRQRNEGSWLFPPPQEFAAKARIGSLEAYENLWNEAAADPEAFWDKWPAKSIGSSPTAKSRLERAVCQVVGRRSDQRLRNCLDAHLNSPRRIRPRHWEGEPGDVRVYTYEMLHREVCKFANVLKKLGIAKGDVVAMYMPMVPELAIAMLACAGCRSTR